MFTFMLATRNRKDSAKKVIDAVLRDKAAFGSLELVVIDGDSDDGTKELLASYGPAIDAWVSVKGDGPYGAWTTGLDMAHGEYVRVLSDDDEYVEGALAEVARFIRERPGVGIVACAATKFIDGKTWEPRRLPWQPDRVTAGSFLRWPLWHGYLHESLFFARELFARHGAWDGRYRVAADTELVERFLRAGATMERAPVVVLRRIYHPGAISVRYRHRGWLEALRIMLASGHPLDAAMFLAGPLVAPLRRIAPSAAKAVMNARRA